MYERTRSSGGIPEPCYVGQLRAKEPQRSIDGAGRCKPGHRRGLAEDDRVHAKGASPVPHTSAAELEAHPGWDSLPSRWADCGGERAGKRSLMSSGASRPSNYVQDCGGWADTGPRTFVARTTRLVTDSRAPCTVGHGRFSKTPSTAGWSLQHRHLSPGSRNTPVRRPN